MSAEPQHAATSIGARRVEELITAIGGKGLSAGSGAAAAVTLALAAACAAKAATISLKHQPDNAALLRCQGTLERLAGFALAGADQDAQAFAAFLKEHTPAAAAQLLRQADQTSRVIDVLAATVAVLAPQIEPAMSGDLVAARALMEAARVIELHNSAETRAAQANLTTPDR